MRRRKGGAGAQPPRETLPLSLMLVMNSGSPYRRRPRRAVRTSIIVTSTSQLQQRLREVLSADQISSDPRVLQNNSEDYAWFSNVLEEALAGCCADVVAWPADEAQLAGVLATAYDTRTPVTIRGSGTGNYGQCVPLHGGLVVNKSRMDNILDLG